MNQKVRWQILEDEAQELYLAEWRKKKEEKWTRKNRKKREWVEKLLRKKKKHANKTSGQKL